ncbi:T9SS type A sorting domain-containing protein [Candidatus Fermentibacteria bacterium]|nr:T9SS type A sorting domain-containing protein [Candidatus Fermentibacteria bacterium]
MESPPIAMRFRMLLLMMTALYPASVPAGSMEVGDTVDLLVPDISYVTEDLQTRQFTCRAVTEHALWLVQDTSFIDLPDTTMDHQVLWGNLIDQGELDSITAQFEGAGVDVWGTVTSALGPMPDTPNDDDSIWIAFADIRDYWPQPAGPSTRLQSWSYVWPEDFDGSGVSGNDHDILYVNLGVYKNRAGDEWMQIRGSIHTWSVPMGLGQLLRVACNLEEERWLSRGLGVYAQHLCYGLTSAFGDLIGIVNYLNRFTTAGSIELTHWSSGQRGSDFCENLGAAFLWLKYVEHREGADVISSIVQSQDTGMAGIAQAIDPTMPDSGLLPEIIYPLYEDWLVANLISPIAGDYEGGIYRYPFLEGTGYELSYIGNPASFVMEFDDYPMDTWIAAPQYGMDAPVFAAQYVEFTGGYSGNEQVWLNCMYNQNNGSGFNLDAHWAGFRVVLADSSTVRSVEKTDLNELYAGTFDLAGQATYLVLSNNNPGGTPLLRYTVSQDTASRDLLLSALQNSLNAEYLQVFSSLYRTDSKALYGFDWVGPKLEVSLLGPDGEPDSTRIVEMDGFWGPIWSGRVHAWSPGSYRMTCSGYDSLGLPHQSEKEFAVAYGGSGDLSLSAAGALLRVPGEEAPPGAMVTLVQVDAMGSQPTEGVPLGSEGGFMTEIVRGPVSVPPVGGTLSFESPSGEAGVFRLGESGWERLDSWWQSGRISCIVTNGGVYACGRGAGVSSPEVPDRLVLEAPAPNPFRTAMIISFSQPKESAATLRIYDMSGRIIVTLEEGEAGPGRRSIHWNGRDCWGSSVPCGVYLFSLESAGQSRTGRVVRIE